MLSLFRWFDGIVIRMPESFALFRCVFDSKIQRIQAVPASCTLGGPSVSHRGGVDEHDEFADRGALGSEKPTHLYWM